MSLAPILTYLQTILTQRRLATSALEDHFRGHSAWHDELSKAARSDPPTMIGIPPGVRVLCDKCIDESNQLCAEAIAAVPCLPDYDRPNWKARLVELQKQHRDFLDDHVEAAGDWKSIPLRPLDEEPVREAIREVQAILEVAAAYEMPAEQPPEVACGSAVSPEVKGSDAQAAIRSLLSVFTNGITDDRFDKAAKVLQDDNLTADEKLTRIHAMMPFPPTVSGETLGKLVGVKKQAVLKGDWWKEHRKGEKKSEIGRRHAKHGERAKQHEQDRTKDDNQ